MSRRRKKLFPSPQDADGQLLRAYRTAKGYRFLSAIARAAGLSRSETEAIETPGRKVQPTVLERYAYALGITAEELAALRAAIPGDQLTMSRAVVMVLPAYLVNELELQAGSRQVSIGRVVTELLGPKTLYQTPVARRKRGERA